jgi:DnaJ homologue, subfamily C, member 28, conserved domain
MTERKPPGMSFTSWIDQQITEAEERGAFDNLPGAGKPLPKRREDDDGQAWLREKLRREGVSADELLPTPLKLRKEIERLADAVPGMSSEQEVRDIAGELNRRIVAWRRFPVGPSIFVALVNTEAMVARWHEAHPAAGSQAPSAAPPAAATGDSRPGSGRAGRWRRRARRPRPGTPGAGDRRSAG